MRKALKWILATVAVLILILAAYVVYVFTSYYRLEDHLILTPEPASSEQAAQFVPVGENLTVTSWNIGFGAYTDQFSFFMDGGEYSRGFSEEIVSETVQSIGTQLAAFGFDFNLVQEVDVDSTRSYHIDEKSILLEALPEQSAVFAQNYDSPYLFWPLIKPHGKSKSGLLTLSDYEITSAERRSLPIQDGFAKFIDLDRCYSSSRIPAEGGKELILYNVHLSAYSTDPTIADQQLAVLYEDMCAEYDAGNYVVCGGDFNKDLLGDSSAVFGVSMEGGNWAKSFPFDNVPDGFSVIAPYDPEHPVPSCRNADAPWNPETNYQLTIDGFLISDNVECEQADTVDLQFAYSDHNPVQMTFRLK
ncbi:MAG: endonuclease/exonuclease/phosphatase family protein [Anaerovoracaceae bacterium]